MALCPDVASLTVNQFDGRNLLWRSVIRYGTSKIWYWPLLMTLARKVQMLTSTHRGPLLSSISGRDLRSRRPSLTLFAIRGAVTTK